MYKWENESLNKYGEKVTLNLIKKQQAYEKEHKNNDCKHCGKDNEGSIVELKNNHPSIIHYGLWVNGTCSFCGRDE